MARAPNCERLADGHFAGQIILSGRKLSGRVWRILGKYGMPLLPGPMTVSNSLSRPTFAQSYRSRKAQIAACLLCLVMVGTSLDGLPDPPAVKPPGNPYNLVSLLHSHVLFAAKSQASDGPAHAPHFQASLFSFGQIFEGRGPCSDPTFVHQATDTSPPCFS
jgi:hypothetical protein